MAHEFIELEQVDAELRSEEAKGVLKQLDSILKTAARFTPTMELEARLTSLKFTDRKPIAPKKPNKNPHSFSNFKSVISKKRLINLSGEIGPMPIKPKKLGQPHKFHNQNSERDPADIKNQVEINRDRLIVSFDEQKQKSENEVELRKWEERNRLYESDRKNWKEKIKQIRSEEQVLYEKKQQARSEIAYKKKLKTWEEHNLQYESELQDWIENKKLFNSISRSYKSNISLIKKNFSSQQKIYEKSTEKLQEYMLLNIDSFLDQLPIDFPNSSKSPTVGLVYDYDTQAMVINVRLPTPNTMPSLKDIKYIKSRNEQKEIRLTQRERDRLYDETLYQLAIALIALVLKADVKKIISLIVFNGRVRFRDEATGKWIDSCIISLQSNRKEFREIKIKHVDARACFLKLKGIGSGKLHGLVPIPPLLEMNMQDERIVTSRSVASHVQQGENIAAMDWEDFEHLVREVFEKEFAQGGGEVKITRASRDRGVDAIAFDPDPIRGGKTVIQAKRYTNLVGVDAVCDLFGTVISEGANGGILITTSKYGPDSYNFAKGKPLKLLDGSNLLHLLEKHGYNARIDLRDAKRILAERESKKN